MEKHVLVYDKDCGNCTWFKRIVNRVDAHRRLDYLSLVEADGYGLLDAVPRSRRHRSFHLVYPGGRVISGSAAVPDLISLLPAGHAASFFILKAPGGRRIVNLIYSMFSRLHDSGSCSYPDASGFRDDSGRILPKTRQFQVWSLASRPSDSGASYETGCLSAVLAVLCPDYR